ncbi:uncharacterized protein PG986_003386 [Apiospora aurea]|uniref:Uncharacterized protein n=1 Tax=Apiospora aurea TaxID=335848 RepID=A0ABR1QT50_9PEZI
MPAYIPPHKLRHAAGDAAAADTDAKEDTQPLNKTSPTIAQFSTRGGGRAGFNGRYGRGGGRSWSSRPTPVDSEVYHNRDIVHYFWPDKEDFTSDVQSTFHASASQEDQLAYIMLFTNANTRWESDQIVFAKSHLRLLPDYKTQMAGKEEYFPQPKKQGFADRRRSELSEAHDNIPNTVSGAKEGLGSKDETEALETKEDPVSVTQENDMTQQEGEATCSPEHYTTDANAGSAPDSPRSPKDKGDPRQLVNTPPLEFVPGQHAPIAVFEQTGTVEFRFAGWYSVARVSVLAPHSSDLVRMLQQKWERRDRWGNVVTKKRDPSGWRTSLVHQWAVVKFEKLAPEVAPAAPTIEKLPPLASTSDSEKGVKGVSELLNDLRLRDRGV